MEVSVHASVFAINNCAVEIPLVVFSPYVHTIHMLTSIRSVRNDLTRESRDMPNKRRFSTFATLESSLHEMNVDTEAGNKSTCLTNHNQ